MRSVIGADNTQSFVDASGASSHHCFIVCSSIKLVPSYLHQGTQRGAQLMGLISFRGTSTLNTGKSTGSRCRKKTVLCPSKSQSYLWTQATLGGCGFALISTGATARMAQSFRFPQGWPVPHGSTRCCGLTNRRQDACERISLRKVGARP